MPISPLIRNQRGVALLYLIIFFTLLGVLISAGVRQFGSKVNLGKTNDTKAELERDVQMITAWAAKNRKLPASSAEYTSVFGATPPLDAWGKEIVYLFDVNASTGELCGRTSTATQYGGADVSFILLSGGDDSTVNSTPGATGTLPAGTYAGLLSSDLYRVVSLDELKSKAGCAGSTQGSLRILNNELPSVCVGSSSYTAAVYASGGVPNYVWQAETNTPSPNWLSFTTVGTNRTLSKSASVIVASAPNLTFLLSDSGGNSISKVLPITVSYSGTCLAALSACAADPVCSTACAANAVCAPAVVADPGFPAVCAADPACSTACSANPACRNACTASPACAAACPACTVTP
jgi:hypothetical protein